jgi:hypothetical protein
VIGFVTLDGTGDHLVTADKAALDVTGDLSLVALVAPDDVTPAGNMHVINKYPASGSQRSYALLWRTDQLLQFNFTEDGLTNKLHQSTAAMPTADGEWVWIRVDFDADNGVGGYDVTFWYSEDPPETAPIFVSWTQLGDTISGTGVAGPASIHAGTTDLYLGQLASGGGSYAGDIGAAWVIDGGFAGTIVANPDFRDDDQGWSSPPGVDDHSNSWAFVGDTFWTPPTVDKLIGHSVHYDFANKTLVIESGA